jgi:hypothetical protein
MVFSRPLRLDLKPPARSRLRRPGAEKPDMLATLSDWSLPHAFKDRVARTMLEVLWRRGLHQHFDRRQLHIGQQVILEASGACSLSEAVLGADFPELGPSTVLHYTTRSACLNIISSGQIGLSSLLLRYDDREFRTFAQVHGLAGYTARRANAEPLGDELMKDLFFLSATLPGLGDEQLLWRDFGGNGQGVRLHLSITPLARGVFRRVRYQEGRTLFGVLNRRLERRVRRIFIPRQLSRIGGFYLPLGVKGEGEVRLLLKRFYEMEPPGGYPIRGVGANARWSITLGAQGPWCRIDLVAVECGPHCDPAQVRHALAAAGRSDVQVL